MAPMFTHYAPAFKWTSVFDKEYKIGNLERDMKKENTRALETDPGFPRHRTLWQAVRPLIDPSDLAHEALHVLRVYRWALRLSVGAGADPDLAGAAALVHDLVNIPKESAKRSIASSLSSAESTPHLRLAGYSSRETEEIADAVRTCSWSSGLPPSGPLGAVLQDADRLDAIGAIGIARTFATAQAMASRGAPLILWAPEDPTCREREPDDRAFALDHFERKLLRLVDGMNLEAAMLEAEKRHALMRSFLMTLRRELEGG